MKTIDRGVERVRALWRGQTRAIPQQLSDQPISDVEVLEEEYVSLNGPFDEQYLKDRAALAKDDFAGRRRLFYRFLHTRGAPRAALCLSGGGIRSATFSLGVLQGLARRNLLEQFDYLSTVSGGGYIGSWLTAWIHRHPAGLSGVSAELGEAYAYPRDPAKPEPNAVHHLREYSHYLAPRFGLLSADAWTLAGIYLRNLAIHWVALLPFLAALLALPRIVVAALVERPGGHVVDVLAWLGLLLLIWALAVMGASLPGERPRTGVLIAGTEKEFLLKGLAPLGISSLLLVIAWKWGALRSLPNYGAWLWVAAGAAVHVVAWCVYAIYTWTTKAQRLGAVMKDLGLVVASGAAGGTLFYYLIEATRAHIWPRLDNLIKLPVFAIAAPSMFWLALLITATAYLALDSSNSNDQEREWYARAGAWVLIVTVAWVALTGIAIVGPTLALALITRYQTSVISVTTISGLFTILAGRSSRSGAPGRQDESDGWTEYLINHALIVAAPIFLLSIVVTLSLLTTLLIQQVSHASASALGDTFHLGRFTIIDKWHLLGAVNGAGLLPTAGVIVVLLGISTAVDTMTDLNVFSLHGMYRDRLIRAYLAASRLHRNPNQFTGFDPHDDIRLTQLRPHLFTFDDASTLAKVVRQYDGQSAATVDPVMHLAMDALEPPTKAAVRTTPPATKLDPEVARSLVAEWNAFLTSEELLTTVSVPPLTDLVVTGRERLAISEPALQEAVPVFQPQLFPVVNMALNLVAGEDLAWQQRKAEAFAITPLHTGASTVCYRRLEWQTGTERHQYGDGVSLGTALTISGAAANPNMGYHSSPVITFLLTLFNARLGVWLGNPQHADASARKSPLVGIFPILAEAFGMTTQRRKYLNLSDGGHFDNLGVYEMVRRRCTLILAVDASEDSKCSFDDLGNALGKIRVDFGVPIKFVRPLAIRARTDVTRPSAHGAIARIQYSKVDPDAHDGWLLYIKPALDGDEPADIRAYASRDTAFPHESTADQFFSETQFESYRALGAYSLDRILEQETDMDLRRLRRLFLRYHLALTELPQPRS